jgi:excisionase family DNA binding protein
MEDLWDVRRVAQHLGVTERTIYSKLKAGELPALRVGGRWRFRPSEIDAWLDGQVGAREEGAPCRPSALPDKRDGGSIAEESSERDAPPGPPLPTPGSAPGTERRESAAEHTTREGLEAFLADIEDPLERRLAFAGLLARACRERGLREPVVVGGHAVEFYTAGGYTTVDLDLVAATEDVGQVLSAWGLERDGRHWYDEDLALLVEAPGHRLEPEQEARVVRVEVRGETALILGLEDLIIDRLNACVHWDSEESCEWAAVLIEGHNARIDWKYLRDRARTEDLTGKLEEMTP